MSLNRATRGLVRCDIVEAHPLFLRLNHLSFQTPPTLFRQTRILVFAKYSHRPLTSRIRAMIPNQQGDDYSASYRAYDRKDNRRHGHEYRNHQ